MYSIRLDGDTRLLMRRLRSFENIDKKGVNAALGQIVRASTLERFKREKSPQGKKWQASIRAREDGGKTLSLTARLRNSIKVKSDETGFAVGTNVIYASTHQLGAKGRTIRAKQAKALRFKIGDRWVSKKEVKITIPARPFLGLSEDDEQEIKATMEDAIKEEG